ncbi:hypothetical protein ACGFNY_05035 [Streptomyces chartreusis]|uniref:hypothetical protein n=1 Tax=Streptomyces chartreusis TaxID=1969 RepID=UPI003717B8D7
MNAAAATHQHTNCLRCGRTLRNPSPDGYGPKCRTKVRKAPVDLADYKAHQVASARELIEDGAIIPLRSVVFIAVSTDGTETYKTAPTACSCPAGVKGSRCYHQLAARMLLAA